MSQALHECPALVLWEQRENGLCFFVRNDSPLNLSEKGSIHYIIRIYFRTYWQQPGWDSRGIHCKSKVDPCNHFVHDFFPNSFFRLFVHTLQHGWLQATLVLNQAWLFWRETLRPSDHRGNTSWLEHYHKYWLSIKCICHIYPVLWNMLVRYLLPWHLAMKYLIIMMDLPLKSSRVNQVNLSWYSWNIVH